MVETIRWLDLCDPPCDKLSIEYSYGGPLATWSDAAITVPGADHIGTHEWTGEMPVLFRGRAHRGDEVSDWSTVYVRYVPEPDFGLGVLAGLLVLLVLRAWGRT